LTAASFDLSDSSDIKCSPSVALALFRSSNSLIDSF
jgi:hypothetical protein